MNKGDKAIVINDCAVKAGSEVEVDAVSCNQKQICGGGWVNQFFCYFNGIRVEIAESDLKPVPKERWKPNREETYWFVNDNFTPINTLNVFWDVDKRRFEAGNYFRTEEECQKLCDKIKKLLTEDNE